MTGFADVLTALSSLVWPAIAAVVLWKVFPNIKSIISSRSFTVKVANMEISVQEATEQIRTQIEDLQKQVIQLRAQEKPQESTAVQLELPRSSAKVPALRRLLWVDDHPSNNALEISQLASNGIDVVQVKTTEEAVKVLQDDRNIGAIVSDMARQEGLQANSQAGLVLLRRIRKADIKLPFLVYCGARGERNNDDMVRRDGGDGATSSAVVLLEWINKSLASSAAQQSVH